MKIAHLTSAHPRDDIRIYRKMCCSLATKYQVSLVVADGKGNEKTEQNVSIVDVGKLTGRLARMTKTVKKVLAKALELKADIYHIHDPELIPAGLTLIKKGYKVIFDAHEDLPKQLKSKPYLNSIMQKVLPLVFEYYERYAFKKFTGLIGATPIITEKLAHINSHSYNVNNYPILGELSNEVDWQSKENEVCYLGGIAQIRGIKEVVASLAHAPKVKLNLAGRFSESQVEAEVKTWPSWQQVNELGFIDRQQAAHTLARSKAGIVTFHNVPNHVDAQPNKMFEYMSAGLPIITSNFPLWRQVVEGNECGICVDPNEPKQIADAINYLIDNPEQAKAMALNGLKAVQQKYNWDAEQQVLFQLYEELV